MTRKYIANAKDKGNKRMNTEFEQFLKVKADLIKQGYPDSRIVFEPKLGMHCFPDVVVFDEDMQTPMLIVECKRGIPHEMALRFQKIANNWRKEIGQSIPILLAVEYNDSLKYYQYDDIQSKTYQSKELIIPAQETQKNKHTFKIQYKKSQQQNSNKLLKIFCYIFAVITAILLVFDFCGCLHFTTTRIILLGICIGLSIAPQYQTLKIHGIELSQAINSNKNT